MKLMAHLHSNHSNIVKGLQKELNGICRGGVKKYYHSASTPNSFKTSYQKVGFINQTTKSKINGGIVHCCSASSTSADQQVGSVAGKFEAYGTYESKKLQFDYNLVSDLYWNVRRMVETEDEMRNVADVQAEAFHEPVFLFDDLFFDFFKAEVLSGLLYRLKNSPPDRYACLVAEPKTDPNESQREVVGVVDVTVMNDSSVLQHLSGAKEYLYVSGIAVLKKFRRQKVATALLKACDILSGIWGFEYLVLRAYEDDYGARKLYSNAGYRVVSADPPWMTIIGRRRRVLMVKRTESQ